MLVVAAPMVSCHAGPKPCHEGLPSSGSFESQLPSSSRDKLVTRSAEMRAGIDSRAQMFLGGMSSSRGWEGITETLTTKKTLWGFFSHPAITLLKALGVPLSRSSFCLSDFHPKSPHANSLMLCWSLAWTSFPSTCMELIWLCFHNVAN